MIDDAVRNGFFIVRQKYQLMDTTVNPPAYFGRNNQPHFGIGYSLGVKTADGFYSDDKVLHPWNYDANYEQYRTDNKYKPVIFETAYRLIGDSTYTIMEFQADLCFPVPSTPFVCAKNSSFGKKGFTTDNANGLKKGWLVWVVSDKEVAAVDTIPLSLMIYRNELVFESGKNVYEIKPLAVESKVIAGGIYVIPHVTDIGQITFRLSGLLSRNGDKWQVVRLDASPATTGGDGRVSNSGNGLTPVNK
jgi:hypothetical protein